MIIDLSCLLLCVEMLSNIVFIMAFLVDKKT